MYQIIILFLFVSTLASGQQLSVDAPVRFLALGDSYTIGQGIDIDKRWPEQLVDSLSAKGIVTDTLVINAQTGRTSSGLVNAISNRGYEALNFNLVSVLIGVNDQFQSRPIEDYQVYFRAILDSALRYVDQDTDQVFVLSIPDYAYTSYGQQNDPQRISEGIDRYNDINRQISADYNISYFDITPISRLGLDTPSWVANDGLHPSARQYTAWVQLLLEDVLTGVQRGIFQNKKAFTLYPNPVDDQLIIEWTHLASHDVRLQLLSLDGRLVRQFPNSRETEQLLDVSQIVSGTYLLCGISKHDSYCSIVQIRH